MKCKSLMLILFIPFIIGCVKKEIIMEERVFPDSLSLSWKHVENQYKGKMMHLGLLTIHNHSNVPLPKDCWALYFNRFRRILPDELPEVIEGRHINGDFYMIAPTKAFAPVKPHGEVVIPVVASHWLLNYTDLPTGNYFVFTHSDGKETFLPVELTYEPMDTSKIHRASYDILPSENPEIRFNRNKRQIQEDYQGIDPLKPMITPSPQRVEWLDEKVFLSGPVTVQTEPGLENEKILLEEMMKKLFIEKDGEGTLIRLSKSDEGEPESYALSITEENRVDISGTDAAGVFYGIQTLRGLFPPDAEKKAVDAIEIYGVKIKDSPRFGYRGLHVDVSRSFRSVDEMKKLLNIMAFYKLNVLHFHLTDDEGWRIEIPGLPELTEIGAFRGHTLDEKEHLIPSLGSGPFPDDPNSNGNGYYSRDDYIDLLKFARDRHIRVVPEIDLPGHSHAAVQSMIIRHDRLKAQGDPEGAMEYYLLDPEDTTQVESVQKWKNNVVNVCMESTYRFCEKVFDELIAMYKDAEVPLDMIHMGGDEVAGGSWQDSPACKAFLEASDEYHEPKDLERYFAVRINEILNKKGLLTAGWEEIASEIIDGKRVPNPAVFGRNMVPYIWNSVWGWRAEDLSYRLANAGFPVVLANVTNLYFDMAYNKDPDERGLYWGAFVDTRTAWEFTPFEVRNCAEKSLFGENIDVNRFEDFNALTEEGKKNILGIQACLWAENNRDMDKFEYVAFPKLLALSERAWSPEPVWEEEKNDEVRKADWTEFVHKAGHFELPRLDAWKVKYRIPLPGWVVKDGLLQANIRFPGLEIRYTMDGLDPDITSPEYTNPVQVTGPVKVAAFNSVGRRSRIQ